MNRCGATGSSGFHGNDEDLMLETRARIARWAGAARLAERDDCALAWLSLGRGG